MLEPRENEMSYKNLEELKFYYMFIAACLTEEEYKKLEDEWKKQGGCDEKPWWLFVAENTKVQLDIKET